MPKVSIIIYPYKGNISLLKHKIIKWRKKYTNVDISTRSNTQKPLAENSHFLALYTTRANTKINLETDDEDKVLTYKDESYLEAYKTFLHCELGREIPQDDFICIDDQNLAGLEKRISEISNEN